MADFDQDLFDILDSNCAWGYYDDYGVWQDLQKKKEEIKCECGVDAVYKADARDWMHERWCPKYKKMED